MWVAFALVSALAGAGTTLMLKRAVGRGGVLESTVAFRLVAGLLLALLTAAVGPWPAPTPAYWRATALVLPPEVAGMVCLSLALRAGDLSHVQPLLGTLPLFVTLGGVLFLGEVPTPIAAVGIVLVTAGVYAVGLRAGGSALEPFRALARSRAGWFAIGASLAWSLATVVHKLGIAEVGPFAWGVTLTLGSGLVLLAALPVLALRAGDWHLELGRAAWVRVVAAAGAFFAVQQVGLHVSLRATQAGYVIALTATSTLLATALGILLLGERTGARARVVGASLVTAGAVIIALVG
jgi:uncharacterized membrane protein